MEHSLNELRQRIKAKLGDAAVIASDETTTRIDGIIHWPLGCLLTPVASQGGSFACWLGWTFVTDSAVLHEIAPRRAPPPVSGLSPKRSWVATGPKSGSRIAMLASRSWPRGTRSASPLSWAHVLRDVQHAIDRGDEAFAPKLRELLRWAIRIGRRRDDLKDTTLAQYHAKAERRLDDLLAIPPACSAGSDLQAQVKTWRGKYFLFMTDRRVPATNNISEREIRPSVVFRKVTSGFRSSWGAQAHAGYRSLTSTAKLAGQTA